MSRADSGLGIGRVLHLLFNYDTDALDRATRHSVHPNATVVASYQCRGNQQYERESLYATVEGRTCAACFHLHLA